jgi:nucleoside 2-deoxyribosyltransferase
MAKTRIYLAAPWVSRDLAKEIAQGLENLGFAITHKWWKYEGESQDVEGPEFLQTCAAQDVAGVLTADVVLVLNTAKSEGKAVEQGLAIAWGKPIVVITPDIKPSSNIFHYLPCYTHVKTLEEAIGIIGNF